jgi:uncharacterized damage-inducible protein DinB
MKRDDAINKLRAARKDLQDAGAGLSEEEMQRAGVVNEWSVKDLLAHIAAWDEEMLRVIQAFAMPGEAQYSYTISNEDDFAEWNSEQVAARRALTLEQTQHEFENARRDLIQIIEGITDPVLMRTKTTPWGTQSTGLELLNTEAEHDVEHAAHIRSWRKKRERWARARQKYVGKRRVTKKKAEPRAEDASE